MTNDVQLSRALEALGPTLAIDSSLGTSVAVSNGANVAVAHEDDPLAHAEVVGELIERALADAGVKARDIAHVVIGIGPGPFTGLRVGIAAAHGFAAGQALQPLGLVSHDAVAHAFFREHPDRHELVVVTDARRKELFTTRYQAPDARGVPQRSEGPELKPADAFADSAHPDAGLVLRPERIPAAALIELAALRQGAGLGFEAAQALYLRSPDVTMPGAPKRVSS